MSENLRKLIGVAVMAAIVVVGVVVTNGDDSDSSRTRNVAFGLPKGAGLDAQIQQPGDAENDLVIAMAAAAKCDEGHVLISTGDPVSPWRCGPLLAAMPTMEDVRAASLLPEGNTRSFFRPCQSVFVSHNSTFLSGEQNWNVNVARYENTGAMLRCIDDWANGRTLEAVENLFRRWIGILEDSNANRAPYCVETFQEITIELAPGNNAVSGLGSVQYRCSDD